MNQLLAGGRIQWLIHQYEMLEMGQCNRNPTGHCGQEQDAGLLRCIGKGALEFSRSSGGRHLAGVLSKQVFRVRLKTLVIGKT